MSGHSFSRLALDSTRVDATHAVAQAQFYPRPTKASWHLDLAGSGIGIRVQKGQLVSERFLRILGGVAELRPRVAARQVQQEHLAVERELGLALTAGDRHQKGQVAIIISAKGPHRVAANVPIPLHLGGELSQLHGRFSPRHVPCDRDGDVDPALGDATKTLSVVTAEGMLRLLGVPCRVAYGRHDRAVLLTIQR
jgi:hypothetical protein